MIYTFISSGTDNGKQFHTPEEALAYLHQIAEHSKTHLDGKLIDMTCTETEFTIHIEEYNYFLGKVIHTYSIKSLSPEENKRLAIKYKEINRKPAL